MKTYLQSIRDLPEEWVDDKTNVICFDGYPLAVNENFGPMRYQDGKWVPLDAVCSQQTTVVCDWPVYKVVESVVLEEK